MKTKKLHDKDAARCEFVKRLEQSLEPANLYLLEAIISPRSDGKSLIDLYADDPVKNEENLAYLEKVLPLMGELEISSLFSENVEEFDSRFWFNPTEDGEHGQSLVTYLSQKGIFDDQFRLRREYRWYQPGTGEKEIRAKFTDYTGGASPLEKYDEDYLDSFVSWLNEL